MCQKSIFDRLPPLSRSVFAYMLKYRPVSRADIGQALGKTAMSIKRAMEPLEESGLIVECGIGNSTGGRKPILYTVDDKRYLMGAINISTTYCEVAIMNLKMEILIIKEFSINPHSMPDLIMDKVEELFVKEIKEVNADKSIILGVGVSVFSSTNRESGKLIRPIISYLNESWVDYPIVRELEQRLRLPIEIEKGTNAAAMLEYHYGKGKSSEKMLYILCAMNIRSAVVMKGELLSIAPYYEDAFGHMTINLDGELCQCGRYGCVDCYTTIPAIIEAFRKGVKCGRHSLLGVHEIDEVTFLDICHASEAGDALACEVITSAASVLGIALANYINLFCPDLVILSGLLVKESLLYFKVAVETAQERINYVGEHKQVTFERRGSFHHSIASGAGAIFLEHLLA